ncbi:MAG: LysR family transcriptional regulator [Thermomonas sp.]|uniref:LysR family transcriptional regulator n=1 Tax=Thermomonas sp. TaxID=1971895 RepID=UPI00260CA70E|nr:LysR substrate-binding domain-containing protein [Thermomonas sp.]MCC7096418.1 LysR family transcriptional regulator [Thermomonas sp.]
MELSWIEDFLSIAQTGNFTKSAQLRHLTQPALSRRIRALEQWLGADLIDRNSYPAKLTQAGERFLEPARVISQQLGSARAAMRRQGAHEQSLRFALPHTLAISYFPQWLARLQSQYHVFPSTLAAGNVHDAVQSLVEGNADLLICYHHEAQPVALDPARYPFLPLGSEPVRAYTRADGDGQPMFNLEADAPVPFLHYAREASLRRIVDRVLEIAPPRAPLLPRYETAMAENLKNMVLEGHGVAFLPASAAARELREGTLVEADDTRRATTLEVRIYRDTRRAHAAIDALWAHLQATPA